MKASELRKKKPAELQQLLADLQREQFTLRMQQGTGQLGRPSQVRTVRREIARIMTVIAERARGSKA
jgi:large subunit ribosomal protein L29